ncbi:unnamed protein product [Caenorhabditis nigoni]
MLVNQMVSYGIYLLGPITQFMISINRLLVMVFVKQAMVQNNQKITVVVLVMFWLAAIAITSMGVIDSCNVIYNPELLNWWSGGCDDDIGEAAMGFVILCAILSNLCNLIVLVKLVMSVIRHALLPTLCGKQKIRGVMCEKEGNDTEYNISGG